MARSINQVILLGNLGQDPELSYTQSGTAKCKFSLCTNKPVKDSDGNWGERPQWHNIIAWGKLAENAAKFLAKGRQACIRGEVESRSYEDRNTGERKWITEITAGDIVFLSDGGGQRGGGGGGGGGGYQGGGNRGGGNRGGGGGGGNRGGGGGYQPPPSGGGQDQGPPPFDPDGGDDIPF
jgi:single-strand DNA-binding protein